MSVPAIDAATSLLRTLRAQEDLVAVEREFPSLAHMLEPGTLLGGKAEWLVEARMKLAVQHRAVAKASRVATEVRAVLAARLRSARRLRLAGAVCAAVGGSAVLVALGNDWRPMGYVTGGLSAFGGLLGVVVEHNASGLGGQSKGVVGSYEELVDCMVQAEQLARQLDLMSKMVTQDKRQEVDDLLLRAEATCVRLNKLLLMVGPLA